VLLGWIGVGLTLTYSGAEVYGLRVIGRQALWQHDASVLTLADQVRGAPGEVIFATGLVLLAVAGVIAAVASRRLAGLARWGAAVVAVGLFLHIPAVLRRPAATDRARRTPRGRMPVTGAGLWRSPSGPVPSARTNPVDVAVTARR
jgi:hypothetical protein